jgi:transposase InsO family protein
MTGEKRMFSSYEKNQDPQRAITFGDGNQGLVKGLGKIAISPDHSISNVFLVDSLDYNLLSVSQLCKMGYSCLFTNIGVIVFRRSDDSVAFKGVLEGQLYLVDFNRAELDTCLIAKTNMGWLWQRRLAHVGMKNLHKLLKGEHILGLTNVHFEKDRVCSACQVEKQVGVHHPHKNIMTTDKPLELLHMDLFGPIAYISIGGSKYCLVIVDDYSRFTWVFFLQEKSQTQETLKGFLRRAQNEFGLRIKKIRSDNGTEFKNSQIEGFLEEEDIKHEFSSPYTPQQNDVVERKNRTLLDMARTMLDEYKSLDRFWAEAINTACYAINRLVGTQNQGYPLRQHEDTTLMRRPLATRRTAPNPTGWAGQRVPRGKERHHTSVSPDPHRRTPGPYIHTGPEPSGRSGPQQGSGTRRTLVCAGVRC